MRTHKEMMINGWKKRLTESEWKEKDSTRQPWRISLHPRLPLLKTAVPALIQVKLCWLHLSVTTEAELLGLLWLYGSITIVNFKPEWLLSLECHFCFFKQGSNSQKIEVRRPETHTPYSDISLRMLGKKSSKCPKTCFSFQPFKIMEQIAR